MKKILLLLFLAAAFVARADKGADVRAIIEKVNDRWQASHPAEHNAFWDNAAYHTGNMEAYRLTGRPEWLTYSERWAEHNDWKGARSDNKDEWKYDRYGESDDYVMFGDWQICFQTYADLYSILPDGRRIRRARQVMEHQMSTPQTDYWWWADGLYMVMPVMTKLYRLTSDHRYLDKLYEYLLVSDSIMLDNETGLYYRDAKYVYPAHKSVNGKKDFWARGDGWVLAALARVIPDLPSDWEHRQFFIDKYLRLADAVTKAQQPGGYWTRSMLDPEHAPGPETSGTAFFTYGLLWGINNGLLTDRRYIDAAEKGWKYLSETALQPDGTVGYVQPIGEKAIPGQVVSATSVTNFGTGAFLLAACEYARYLEAASAEKDSDRAFWSDLAVRMASPVIGPMAEGRLKEKMKVEVSPTWDGRKIDVAYMEAFGRLMAGIAPWLSLPDDRTREGKTRARLRSQALKAYANAVDPDSPDCLLWEGEGQALVDAAYIAQSFLRGYDALWLPLDSVTKQRYIDRFKGMRKIDPPYTNWLLFSATIEAFLAKAGADADIYRINSAIRKTEEWYAGDGWYADGPNFTFDYYSSYVFHPMYLDMLQAMKDSGEHNRIDYAKYYDRALGRAQKAAIILERFVSPEGTFPVVGRSIPYRTAALQPLAMMALHNTLPEGLAPGQVRNALSMVTRRMFSGDDNFNSDGYLTIGFCGSQPNIADWYTNNGSLYMASLSLLPLGLPASHPFWTDAPAPTTSQKAWSGAAFPKDHLWKNPAPTPDRY